MFTGLALTCHAPAGVVDPDRGHVAVARRYWRQRRLHAGGLARVAGSIVLLWRLLLVAAAAAGTTKAISCKLPV